MSESSLLTLVTRERTPPPGWVFVDPETNFKILRGDFNSLIDACRKHRISNSITIPNNFSEIVEDQIARKSPDSFVSGRAHVVHHIGVKGVTVNEKVVALERIWKLTGHLIVNVEEAQSRGEICRRCGQNVPGECITCNGVYEWLLRKFAIPKLPVDHWLHICKIGTIYNKAQVHLTDAVFLTMVPKSSIALFPEVCWKRKLLERHYAPKESNEKETE